MNLKTIRNIALTLLACAVYSIGSCNGSSDADADDAKKDSDPPSDTAKPKE